MDFDLSRVEGTLPFRNTGAKTAVQTAKKRVWLLLELTDDLAWLSKMRAEENPFHKEWVNVYPVLLGRIQALEGEAGKKGIEFKLHGDPQVHLWADPEAFQRVADHLLSNAVKYTPEGRHSVLVEFKVQGKWISLAVTDEGIGIPRKQQAKLFEEFFRASNARKMERFGTGLGLSVVKRIMDWHGGSVAFTSDRKNGTRAETWWPCAGEGRAP
jgi:signal transduction histidine kinase